MKNITEAANTGSYYAQAISDDVNMEKWAIEWNRSHRFHLGIGDMCRRLIDDKDQALRWEKTAYRLETVQAAMFLAQFASLLICVGFMYKSGWELWKLAVLFTPTYVCIVAYYWQKTLKDRIKGYCQLAEEIQGAYSGYLADGKAQTDTFRY